LPQAQRLAELDCPNSTTEPQYRPGGIAAPRQP
jgi:hypothetical protein